MYCWILKPSLLWFEGASSAETFGSSSDSTVGGYFRGVTKSPVLLLPLTMTLTGFD